MNNSTFRWERFWLIVKKLIVLNKLPVIGLLGFSIIGTVLWYSFILIAGNKIGYDDFNLIQFWPYIVVLLMWWVVCPFVTSVFNNDTKGNFFLLLPASQLEKYVAVVFVSMFMLPVIYGVFRFILDSLFVNFALADWQKALEYNNYSPSRATFFLDKPSIFLPFYLRLFITIEYLLFHNICSLLILGSLYFERFAFFKTSAIIIVTLGIIVVFYRYYDDAYHSIGIAQRLTIPAMIFFFIFPFYILKAGYLKFQEMEEG